MESTTLYYLFSTLAQAYAALLGVMGMFAVYRLQGLRELRRSVRDRLVPHAKMFFSEDPTSMDAETLVDRWPNEVSKQDLTCDNQLLKDHIQRGNPEVESIKTAMIRARAVRDSFKCFMGYHVPLIGISMLLLLFAERLKCYWTLILIILIAVLSVSSWLIWKVALALLYEDG